MQILNAEVVFWMSSPFKIFIRSLLAVETREISTNGEILNLLSFYRKLRQDICDDEIKYMGVVQFFVVLTRILTYVM